MTGGTPELGEDYEHFTIFKSVHNSDRSLLTYLCFTVLQLFLHCVFITTGAPAVLFHFITCEEPSNICAITNAYFNVV